MVSEAIFEAINRLLSSFVVESRLLNENEIYTEISPENIKDACNNIYSNIDCVLIDLFGNDLSVSEKIQVYYTFSVRSSDTLITLYTKLEKSEIMLLESIANDIPSAAFYEREIQDMYGIQFNNIPDSRELVHHGNFTQKVYPLRKEFKANTRLGFEKRELQLPMYLEQVYLRFLWVLSMREL